MTKLEKFGVIGSFIVSIIGLAISIYALIQTKEANDIARKQIESNLTVDIVDGKLPTANFIDRVQTEVTFFPSELPYGAYFFKDYYLLISNQGMKSTSLEDARVVQLLQNGMILRDGRPDPQTKNWWGSVDYEFKKLDSEKKLLYPIKIDVNSYELFLLRIKYFVPKFAWELSKLKYNETYMYDIAEKVFDNIGYPFRGQFRPDFQIKSNERTNSPNQYYQKFCLILTDSENHSLRIPVDHHIHAKMDVRNTRGNSTYCK